MCYKIFHGLVDLESSCYFTRSQYPSTRGNMFKLVKPAVVSERDKNFFNDRVINMWNSLPDNIVAVSSISSFKRNLNGFYFIKFLLFQ
jgi:hypothetical protein